MGANPPAYMQAYTYIHARAHTRTHARMHGPSPYSYKRYPTVEMEIKCTPYLELSMRVW